MSEEKLTIITWLARQFFDTHKDNGWLIAELDRRLPGPLCSIAAISPDGLSYITRTGETLDNAEAKFRDMASWLNGSCETIIMRPVPSGLSCALRVPEIPGQVLTAILLYGPTESTQARFEVVQKILEIVRQEAEQKAAETMRREEENQREDMAEAAKEENQDAERGVE